MIWNQQPQTLQHSDDLGTSVLKVSIQLFKYSISVCFPEPSSLKHLTPATKMQ